MSARCYQCSVLLSLRTKMERENKDLALEQIKLKAAEQHVTVRVSSKGFRVVEGKKGGVGGKRIEEKEGKWQGD